MTGSLLDRQRRLVEYMTSAAAIFDDGRERTLVDELPDIARALLHVEACFSHAKRMEKIAGVLSKTFELLGSGREHIVREFAETCPPVSISRLENARQFRTFLTSHWLRNPPDPPYLSDVASCELACAEVDADDGNDEALSRKHQRDAPQRGIRRCPSAILLRCAYDVRPIFEARLEQGMPTNRETPLVVALPAAANRPQVFEVPTAVFDLLALLDDWTDPPELDAAPELAKLIADLAKRGLVEMRQ